jgi:hypothetical protein
MCLKFLIQFPNFIIFEIDNSFIPIRHLNQQKNTPAPNPVATIDLAENNPLRQTERR